jgi:hypothetical protein
LTPANSATAVAVTSRQKQRKILLALLVLNLLYRIDLHHLLYGDDGLEPKQFTYSEKSEGQRSEYTARLSRIPHEKRVYVDESGINTYGS